MVGIDLVGEDLLKVELVIRVVRVSLIGSVLGSKVIVLVDGVLNVTEAGLVFRASNVVFIRFVVRARVNVESVVSDVCTPC